MKPEKHNGNWESPAHVLDQKLGEQLVLLMWVVSSAAGKAEAEGAIAEWKEMADTDRLEWYAQTMRAWSRGKYKHLREKI